MKKILIVLGVLFVVGIGAAVVGSLFAQDKFQPYAEKILADLKAGKEDEVYAGASWPFHREVSLERFRDEVAFRKATLGEFRRVVRATGGGISASTATGSIGSVSLDLEYERASVSGNFRFLKEGEDWKLLEMYVAFDERVAPTPDRTVLEGLCRDLFALYDASSFTALYARFSQPLKDAWKADVYEPQIRELFAKSGRTTSATLRETKDEPDGTVRVRFDVGFENGPGEAVFGWRWRTSGPKWELVAFDLHLGSR